MEELVETINEIYGIESKFQFQNYLGTTVGVIYNNKDFKQWMEKLKKQLNEEYSKNETLLIQKTIGLANKRYNGVNDRENFNELKLNLEALKIEILSKNNKTNKKNKKIFISHSSKDFDYIEKIVDLIEAIGVKEDMIFCSSIPEYGVGLGKNILKTISEQYEKYELIVIFILSKNYYKSEICLNEMGAAWILKKESLSILIPGFERNQIKGVIDPNDLYMNLGATDRELKGNLNNFKKFIIEQFNLDVIDENKWERKRDNFIRSIK